MAKTVEEIKKEAKSIRGAVNAGENTAERVGGTMCDIVDFVEDISTPINSLISESSKKPLAANQGRILDEALRGNNVSSAFEYPFKKLGNFDNVSALNKDINALRILRDDGIYRFSISPSKFVHELRQHSNGMGTIQEITGAITLDSNGILTDSYSTKIHVIQRFRPGAGSGLNWGKWSLAAHEEFDNMESNLRGNLYTISGYISPNSGALGIHTSYVSTDFIPITTSDDILVFGYSGPSSSLIAFYDENKTFIKAVSGEGISDEYLTVSKDDIPFNARYVRGNAHTNTPNPRISALSLKSVFSYINNLPKPEAANNPVRKADMPFFGSTKNLFNKDTVVDKEYVRVPPATGTDRADNYTTSDYIPVEPSTNYIASGFGTVHYFIFIAKYKKDKTSIPTNEDIQKNGYKFTTPDNCYFIKMTVKTATVNDNTDPAKIQLEKGDTPTDYERYGFGSINGIPIIAYDPNIREQQTKGKKWLIFGDSITTSADSWVKYVKPLTASSITWNRAISGASYKYAPATSHDYTQVGDDGKTYYTQNASEQVQCALIANDISNPDIIVIALGTNDGGSSIGDYTTAMSKATLDELDKTKLYEAMRWVFWTLQTEYPGAMFYAVTPIQRASSETELLTPLYDAIKKMAARYNFIIVDATAESGIVKDFEVVGQNGRYLHDGLHPYNVKPFMGDKLIARCICSKVLSTYLDISVL